MKTNKMKTITFLLGIGIVLAGRLAMAHCEIPCGIYGDRMRGDMLREHFTTLEKSARKVVELQDSDDINYNQLVRWVDNKELHADKVHEIVYQYFMTQRVKPVEEGEEGYDEYVEQITLLHGMLVQAMRVKQTTEIEHVENLRDLLNSFEDAYFEEEEEEGESDHSHSYH